MADIVQAVGPFVARLSGNQVLVRAGDLYGADDALVTAFPRKFREAKVLTSPMARLVDHKATAKRPIRKASASKSK